MSDSDIDELPDCERCGQPVEPDWVEKHRCFSAWTGQLEWATVKISGYPGMAFRALFHSVEQERIVAVPIGDDVRYTVDVADVTVIGEDEFCSGCGSTVCTADGRNL